MHNLLRAKSPLALAASVSAVVLLLSGCANKMNSMVAPAYQTRVTQVSSLGVTGGGASVAAPAFLQRGYKVIEVSGGMSGAVEEARKKAIPFLATVDAVGAEGSWWDGFFDYSMRVTETKTGAIVWSATAEYGQGGFFINQVKSSKSAMKDMVEKFSRNFPPR